MLTSKPKPVYLFLSIKASRYKCVHTYIHTYAVCTHHKNTHANTCSHIKEIYTYTHSLSKCECGPKHFKLQHAHKSHQCVGNCRVMLTKRKHVDKNTESVSNTCVKMSISNGEGTHKPVASCGCERLKGAVWNKVVVCHGNSTYTTNYALDHN